MSFTVQEARAAFFSYCYSPPLHVGGPELTSKTTCKNSEARTHMSGPAKIIGRARDLNTVQVYRAKENRNVTKEIPQRINQAWR